MKIASYRKNILAIRIVNSGGGAEASVGNLLNFLKKNNIIIRDLCFSEFKKKGRSLRNFFAVFRYIYQIRVESKTADYLLACVEGAPFLIAAIATMGISKPPVLWLHCEPTEYLRFASVKQRLLIRLSILLADNIICASPWYANYISQSSRKKVQFLSNFIVTESISDGVPYKCDVPRSHYIYVGSLSRLKNVSACFIFLSLLGGQKSIFFDIYGNGPDREKLIEKANLVKDTCVVSFKGHVAVDWDSYRAKSILLVPSFTEALPMVIVEALLRGIPVIVNKYKGHEFFSTHDGLVEAVDFGCSNAVKTASEVLGNLSNIEYQRRLSNTKLFLIQNFDNAKNFSSLMGFLSAVY